LRFLKKALKRHGKAEKIVTDGLRSYPAAMREMGNLDRREMGRHLNNRAENSSAVSTTRARDAAILPDEVATEVRLGPGGQPILAARIACPIGLTTPVERMREVSLKYRIESDIL